MSQSNRIIPSYTNKVVIPKKYGKYLWDHIDGKVILEKFVLRILMYGKFPDVRWLYQQYPDESFDIANKYYEIHRGVKYWINLWHLQPVSDEPQGK
ncbi:hypothetical protein JYT51_01010 [Candidatus Amoebophilus asiaticus]|nr:hypothetical protein [Candidatus Amoebophilus asiaticus]